NAIAANNITFLKKLPGIGAKAAAQIILDLKGQLTGSPSGNPNQYDEVRDALKGLGYKIKEIENVLASINEKDATNEDILRLALKKLKK
ncbi:MAG TPA: Holliday junction branch migration protein RuvA, partial [Bacilli bacterium]|nr:Holliday junction branch migration protein RuvA [Bacilli bacterium]HQC33052.1 Holliday junction branch migration protein RuvA [Bacilli bacterium]